METEPVTNEVTPESLQRQLADLMALMTEARSELQSVKDARHEVREELRETRERIAREIYTLEQERMAASEAAEKTDLPLREAEFDIARKLREAERTAESLQRQIDQARRAELAAAEWATLEKRWDNLTMGAPWREWAKDHQLDGARKITYEGRMILGDTMGLGKTLTSLIALDMIEAATKEATPDNPIEFGSMK